MVASRRSKGAARKGGHRIGCKPQAGRAAAAGRRWCMPEARRWPHRNGCSLLQPAPIPHRPACPGSAQSAAARTPSPPAGLQGAGHRANQPGSHQGGKTHGPRPSCAAARQRAGRGACRARLSQPRAARRCWPQAEAAPCSFSSVRNARRWIPNSNAEGWPSGPASAASCSRTQSSAGARLWRWICRGRGSSACAACVGHRGQPAAALLLMHRLACMGDATASCTRAGRQASKQQAGRARKQQAGGSAASAAQRTSCSTVCMDA